MLQQVGNICYMQLDKNLKQVYSNLPNPEVFYLFMAIDENRDSIDVNLSAMEQKVGRPDPSYGGKPVVFTNSLGMGYVSTTEVIRGRIKAIHVLGPVFLNEYSTQKVEKSLAKMSLSVKTKRQFMETIQGFPVVPLNRLYEYGMMLYYCITGEKMRIDEFEFSEKKKPDMTLYELEDPRGAYMLEQSILKLVEEGNLAYREQLGTLWNKGMQERMSENHLLAQRLGYTDYYFSSKFKKEVGMTVRDYMIRKRVERACELLKSGNDDIQDISEKVGFSSRSYFGEVFRQIMGISPGEYRKEACGH